MPFFNEIFDACCKVFSFFLLFLSIIVLFILLLLLLMMKILVKNVFSRFFNKIILLLIF